MRAVLKAGCCIKGEGVDEGEFYWVVNYLAKKGDPAALKELDTGKYYYNCLQYAPSVELFGKWKYRPAIPYLVDTALNAACLNIVDAAEHSLQALYPDAPRDFKELSEMQRYYCDRARRDGFDVKCIKE
jgi:hypothetical protein